METQQQLSHKEKFNLIRPWLSDVFTEIKKDLKQEHLIKDRAFFNKYFKGKTINKLTSDELVEAYYQAIQDEENGEAIGEFVFERWLLKNTDLYHFFDHELSKISDDFTTLKILDPSLGAILRENSCKKFGPEKTYIFSILNGVVFDGATLQSMHEEASKIKRDSLEQEKIKKENEDIETRIRDNEIQMARLKDRYEGRLAGWERKYDKDVTALKKQVAHLQRQLQSN